MKRFLLTLFVTTTSIATQAQYFNSEEYDIGEAAYDEVLVDDSTDIYYLLNKHLFNYYYDGSELIEEYLIHKKVYLNSNDAIEGFNKIYISGSEDGGLLNFKARVINPSGKITEITEDKILTGTDEETEDEYTYFAMEGLEIGSQLEYFYIRKVRPKINGIYIDIQSYFPVKRAEIDIITPWNLVMTGKTYHLDRAFETDTAIDDENRIYLHIDSLPGLEKEVNAYREANLGRVVFKLDQNLYTGKKNLVAYSHIAQNVVNNASRELSKKEQKALAKIRKEIERFEPDNEVSAARKIENYLKTHYQVLDYSNPVLHDISEIYRNKALNELGALVLYTNLFKDQGIDYKIVYTSDRSKLPFDTEFEADLFLSDLLLYLPEEDEFLDFNDPMSRLGYISALNTACNGLFIEEMDLNGNVVGVSTIEYIPHKSAAFTTDTLEVRVHFADDLYNNSLSVHRVLTGYDAKIYQPLFNFIVDENNRKEFRESLLKYLDEDANVKDLEIKNGEGNLLGVKPLIANGNLESAGFMEKAGPNYLFKIGKLIGPQLEMYQEKNERIMDVQSDHARTYFRTITFEIPEGYEVSGLDKLNMDKQLVYEDEVSSRFVSSYKKEGNTITVEILEFYREVEYPKELFEDYKEVINAAADFNKKTLLLKKA